MTTPTKVLLGIAAILIIGYVGYMVYTSSSAERDVSVEITPTLPPPTNTDSGDNETNTDNNETFTVRITDSGYTPNKFTIKVGTTVVFVNENSAEHWPASAIHPTHRVYPGSDINKCGTAEENVIFDACRGLSPGESWPFTFNEVGKWAFHDHINPGLTGMVTVVAE